MLCYVTLRYVMLCYIILCYIILYIRDPYSSAEANLLCCVEASRTGGTFCSASVGRKTWDLQRGVTRLLCWTGQDPGTVHRCTPDQPDQRVWLETGGQLLGQTCGLCVRWVTVRRSHCHARQRSHKESIATCGAKFFFRKNCWCQQFITPSGLTPFDPEQGLLRQLNFRVNCFGNVLKNWSHWLW